MILQNPIIYELKKHHFSRIKYSQNLNNPMIIKDCAQEIAKEFPISFNIHYLYSIATKDDQSVKYSNYKIENISESSNLYNSLFKISFILSPEKLIYLQRKELSKNQKAGEKFIDYSSLETFILYIKGLHEEIINVRKESIDSQSNPSEFVKNFISDFESSFEKKKNPILEKVKNDFLNLCTSVLKLGEERNNNLMLRREDSSSKIEENQGIIINNGLFHKQMNPKLCMFCQEPKSQTNFVCKKCSDNEFHFYHLPCFKDYLLKMSEEGKTKADIVCLICGNEFLLDDMKKADENYFNMIMENSNIKSNGKEVKEMEKSVLSSKKISITNSNCDHKFAIKLLSNYFKQKCDFLKPLKEIGCPEPGCTKHLDAKIILSVLEDLLANRENEQKEELISPDQSINQKIGRAHV